MGSEVKKLGIEESKEVLAFCDSLVDDLLRHKSDDGKIDGYEITQTLIGNLPAAVRAGTGAGEVQAELKDLSPEEQEELVGMSMVLAMKIVSLVTGKSE